MRTRHILFITIAFLLLSNCEKNPSTNNMHVEIAYKDKQGTDLLDPTKQNSFTTNTIHVYNVSNGKKTEVNYPNYDFPHNFRIYKNDDLATFYLSLTIETDTTLLELNNSITDTVTCIAEKSNGIGRLKKVWYNGVMEWDNIANPQGFTIVK